MARGARLTDERAFWTIFARPYIPPYCADSAKRPRKSARMSEQPDQMPQATDAANTKARRTQARPTEAEVTDTARKKTGLRWRRPSFPIVCAAMAAESVAANVVHPVEPAFYISLALPDWIFGVAFASMALGLFLFAPFWGLVSDRIGRVRTLALTAVLYGLAQLAFLVSTTVPSIIVARFAAGATCAGFGVAAMAYVADISDARTCGRNMTLLAAVQSAATAMGYLVGGVVGQNDPGHSFILQFFILLLVAGMALLLLAEGGTFERAQEPLTLGRANPLAALAGTRELLSPWMCAFLASTVLACVASSAFDNSFNYYLRDQFSFPTTYNGYIYAAVGVLGLLANLTVGLRLQRARDGERALGGVLACAAVLLASTVFAVNMPVYLGLNIAFYIFNTLYVPMMQALSIQGDTGGHGKIAGLFQSAKSVGMVAGSLAAGFVYEVSPQLPFVMAAVSFALAAGAIAAARKIALMRGRRG